MSKTILSINAGSSSVKVSVFTAPADWKSTPKQLAEISVSGLTAPPATLDYTRGTHTIKDQEIPNISSPEDAYETILRTLTQDADLTELQSPDDIDYACHRIVHGGDYDKPVRIDRDTYHRLEALSDLAPLHNAGALAIVKAVHARGTNVTNVAFFDSAFHATLPPAAHTYAIDQTIAKKNKLRKYGFHGLSYAFVARATATYLVKRVQDTNLIALHLGSGCSACVIQGGKSIDTSMGLTPLAGLPGATRSGDVDPSLIFHFTNSAGDLAPGKTADMHITTAEQILNKQSGWQALTGTTDFGTITSRARAGDADCKLAFDILVDRLVGYIGSYYVKLGGDVDALVFAGGIGEKGAELREAVVRKVRFLGFDVDQALNGAAGGKEGLVVEVGDERAQHRVLVCRTDEQGEMARELGECVDRL